MKKRGRKKRRKKLVLLLKSNRSSRLFRRNECKCSTVISMSRFFSLGITFDSKLFKNGEGSLVKCHVSFSLSLSLSLSLVKNFKGILSHTENPPMTVETVSFANHLNSSSPDKFSNKANLTNNLKL